MTNNEEELPSSPQPGHDGIPVYQTISTLDQLRAVADPLRRYLRSLLKEKPRTVKELGDILGEPPYRLYYHVNELERVGLVKLVRTEFVSGVLHKYYRATARFIDVPFELLFDEPESQEAQAVFEYAVGSMQTSAADIRHLLTHHAGEVGPDDFFIERTTIQTTPDKLRELVHRVKETHEWFHQADTPGGELRVILSSSILPMVDFQVEVVQGEWTGRRRVNRPSGAPPRRNRRRRASQGPTRAARTSPTASE
jgi:DNA-binding transcriptional ArsR family regulator